MEETIKLKKESVLAAYKVAREAGKDYTCEVLEELFGKDTFKPKDIRERIKTFEDACEWCLTHDKRHLVAAYQSMCGNGGTVGCEDVEAYLKLRIICAALNEGWEPQFTDDEYRYYLWFFSFSKEEFEMMTKEERGVAIGGAFAKIIAHGGRVYVIENRALSGFYTGNGSQLAFKSEELANYSGEQFIDIWADFVY